MFRRIVLLIGIGAALCALVSCPVFAQSKEEGIKLFNEADALQEKAQSSADMQQAVQKYQQALAIFERVGFKPGIGATASNLGIVFGDWGQYDKAVGYFEKGLAIARELRDRRSEGQNLNNLGLVFRSWGHYDKAVEYYAKSLAVSREIKDRKGEGATLRNLGIVFGNWGQYKKAVEYYEKSLAIAKDLKDREMEETNLMNLGNVYADSGQYDKAVEYYEKSLAIALERKDRRGEAKTLTCLGIVFWNWGQYDKAVKYYEKSLAIAKEFKDRMTEGKILNNSGVLYKDWGQHDKAADYYEKSLAIDRALKDRKGEGTALDNLGSVYKNWGQYGKAVEYYEKSLAIARELKNPKGEAGTLNNLGLVYADWGQYDKAVEYYDKSLAINRRLKDLDGEGVSLNNLGLVYANWGDLAKAVEYYENSLAICRELKDRKGEGVTLNSLGNVYKAWGQYDKAVDCYEKSLAIARELKNRMVEENVVGNLGNVYMAWGQYDKSVDYYEKSLAISRELKDRKVEGQTLINLGRVRQDSGRLDEAEASFKQALKIYESVKIPTDWPKNHLGMLYLDKGDIAKAEPLIKEARYASSTGRLFLAKKDSAKAKEPYESLLKSAEKNRDANNLFTAHTGLGLVWEEMGDNPKAAEHYGKAVDYTEDLRASLSAAGKESFFDVKVGGFSRTDPYKGLARVLAKINRPIEALKQSEACRARVFAETLSGRSSGLSLDVPKDVVEKDSRLKYQIAALTKDLQTAYEKGNRLRIDSLEPQLGALKTELSSHIGMLRKHYPLLAATKYPQPMGLEQTALKDDEWVLSYDVTESGMLIYLTKGKSLVKGLFKAIPRKDVDELVRKYREPMDIEVKDKEYEECAERKIEPKKCAYQKFKRQLSAFDFGSGKKLTDMLLGDILADLPKDAPVIIVPDGSLGVVPFEMLVLNDGGKIITDERPQTSGAEFFGDRNPISYYQSITALTLARTLGKQQKPGERLLAMVDPVFGEDDERLIEVGREKHKRERASLNLVDDKVISIKSELGLEFQRLELTTQLGKALRGMDPARTDLYGGMDATKSRLLQTDLSPYRSIVFATHGYARNDLPGIKEPVLILTLPGLPEGQNGFLTMTEVTGLKKMNADIVALTACETGLGRRISGEGTMNMGRAFQYAGARSVLMSLWSVAEESSVNLVESFFKHLKEGKNRLDALRLARKEIRDAGYNHPFYWAPFILVGETGDTAFPDTSKIDGSRSLKQYPASAATQYPPPLSLEQTALRDNEWAITYKVTDPGTTIYLTRGKNLVKGLFKPVPRQKVDELVRKFVESVAPGPGDSLPQKLATFDFVSGKQLADLLLGDILPNLPKTTPVIIIPDGSLGVVSFEMLVLNDGGKIVTNKQPQTSGVEFFGDRNPISYYQSLTALTLARIVKKHQKPGDRILVITDPVFSADDPRLKEIEEKRRRQFLDDIVDKKLMGIKAEAGVEFPRLPRTGELGGSLKRADPAKTDLYTGVQAQKSLLLKKDLSPYATIVFATHSYSGKDLPGIQEPVLILTLLDQPEGQDGFLRASEVLGLKLHADLVALIASNSLSMGTCFLEAGAKSALASLWSVSEMASVNLAENFFKHQKEGKNKLEALRLARDEIRKAGYDHPFYWAPFILVGEVN